MKKTRAKKLNREKKPKFHSFEQVFKKVSEKKEFRASYNEEVIRLKLAAKIRQLRHEKKFTQVTLAEKAKMPQSVIARVESGEHSFSLGTLNRIAQVFNKEVQLH